MNLITNAIKYNNSKVKIINIGFKPAEDYEYVKDSGSKYVFYVEDNGIGIAHEHYDDVFRIFKRLNYEDENTRGSGVGLTFVKKIIQRHGGVIWLDSMEGSGTTFYFTIGKSYGISKAPEE